MDTTYIETERLILRSWKMSDRDVFAELNSNDNVMRYFPAPLSVEESNGFVDNLYSIVCVLSANGRQLTPDA